MTAGDECAVAVAAGARVGAVAPAGVATAGVTAGAMYVAGGDSSCLTETAL